MKVRIINSQIAELNTGSKYCNIEFPDELLGQHLSKFLYNNGVFEVDPDWVEPNDTIPLEMSGGTGA